MAEYGNPDSDDWNNFLYKYSPYHHIHPISQSILLNNQNELNINNNIENNNNPLFDINILPPKYPPLFMATSTRDDRVHPYHARCFVKRLEDLNMESLYYYENMEGGHGGAADNKQQAFMTVLYCEFLYKHICTK